MKKNTLFRYFYVLCLGTRLGLTKKLPEVSALYAYSAWYRLQAAWLSGLVTRHVSVVMNSTGAIKFAPVLRKLQIGNLSRKRFWALPSKNRAATLEAIRPVWHWPTGKKFPVNLLPTKVGDFSQHLAIHVNCSLLAPSLFLSLSLPLGTMSQPGVCMHTHIIQFICVHQHTHTEAWQKQVRTEESRCNSKRAREREREREVLEKDCGGGAISPKCPAPPGPPSCDPPFKLPFMDQLPVSPPPPSHLLVLIGWSVFGGKFFLDGNFETLPGIFKIC